VSHELDRNADQTARAGDGAIVDAGSDIHASRVSGSRSEARDPSCGGSEGGSAPLPPAKPGSRLDTVERVRIFERARDVAATARAKTGGQSCIKGANKAPLDVGPVFSVVVNRRTRAIQFTLDAARQLTFGAYDGTAKLEPAAYDLVDEHELAPELPTADELEIAGQLRMFTLGGTSMPGDDWTDQYSLAMEGWGTVLGRGTKRGRSMARRAVSVRACGMFAERRVCPCGACAISRRVVDCKCRACIRGCAKVNADSQRMALERTMLELKAAKHVHLSGRRAIPYTAYLLTVTVAANPLDPAEYHPDAIAARERATTRAMRRIGKEVLTRDPSGNPRRAFGMHWRTEVSHGGNVHKHAACWSMFVSVEELAHMRRIVREESPSGLGNIDYKVMVRKKRKDGTYTDPLREAAKYVTKGSSPKRSVGKHARSVPSIRMHPVLAANVEVAFFGVQLEGGMGTLRHIAREAEELEGEAEELEIPTPACMKPTEHGDCGDCGPCLEKNRQYCTTCGVLPSFVGYVPIYEVREIHGVCNAPPLSDQERKDARYLARSENATDAEAMRERFTRHAVNGRGPPDD